MILSLTRGNIKTALASLRSNRMRTFLTMLGVIVGVVSVVSVVSIGEGVKRQISQQIDTVGKDLIVVRPGQLTSNGPTGLSDVGKLFGSLNVNGSLNNKDLSLIQKTDGVHLATALSVVGGGVTGTDSPATGITVLGAGPNLPEVLKTPVQYGTYFTSGEDEPVNMAI